VLGHQVLTLSSHVITVVLTAILYIVIPKGLFPVQDVGVIQGISVADNSISYEAMATARWRWPMPSSRMPTSPA
jgi:multidrug efflux pump